MKKLMLMLTLGLFSTGAAETNAFAIDSPLDFINYMTSYRGNGKIKCHVSGGRRGYRDFSAVAGARHVARRRALRQCTNTVRRPNTCQLDYCERIRTRNDRRSDRWDNGRNNRGRSDRLGNGRNNRRNDDRRSDRRRGGRRNRR